MQNRDIRVQIFGWLIGVFVSLGVTAIWRNRQTWDYPWVAGRRALLFSLVPARVFWGRAIGSQDSKPALPHPEPITRPSCSFRQPCRQGAYLFHHATAGRAAAHDHQGRSVGRRAGDRRVSHGRAPGDRARRRCFPRAPLGVALGHGEVGCGNPTCPRRATGEHQGPGQSEHATVRCQGLRSRRIIRLRLRCGLISERWRQRAAHNGRWRV